MRPQRQHPTRLPHLWDSPGKNTGVGCHFLLQCMKVKNEGEVAQLCPTPSDPMDCSLPGCCTHGTFQARVLEWGAIAFSNLSHWGSSTCSLSINMLAFQTIIDDHVVKCYPSIIWVTIFLVPVSAFIQGRLCCCNK